MNKKPLKKEGWTKLLTEYKTVRTLTEEQIKDIKKNPLEQAQQALVLRKDLLAVKAELDKEENWETFEYFWLQKYLISKYANLEYELFNNGLSNLIPKIVKLWEHADNKKLEQVIRNINDKKYGNHYPSNYGDCLECGKFGELIEGYHYECQDANEDKLYCYEN